MRASGYWGNVHLLTVSSYQNIQCHIPNIDTFCSVVICYACGKSNTQIHIVFSVGLWDKTLRFHIVAGLQL